jgi:DNA-binding MarR family transcriptional regulator
MCRLTIVAAATIVCAMSTPSGSTSATQSPVVPRGDVPAPVALWSALVAVHAALNRAIERDTTACQVIGPDVLGVLLPLAEAPGRRLRLRELAERTGLTPSGLTRRLDVLVADGLVARAVCDLDRRGMYAALTPKGLVAVPGALAHHANVLERSIGERLDQAGVAQLTKLLDALATP